MHANAEENATTAAASARRDYVKLPPGLPGTSAGATHHGRRILELSRRARVSLEVASAGNLRLCLSGGPALQSATKSETCDAV